MPLNSRAPNSTRQTDYIVTAISALRLAAAELEAATTGNPRTISHEEQESIEKHFGTIAVTCERLIATRIPKIQPATRFDVTNYRTLSLFLRKHPQRFWSQWKTLSRLSLHEADIAAEGYAQRQLWGKARLVKAVVLCNLLEIAALAVLSRWFPSLGELQPAVRRIAAAVAVIELSPKQ